MIKSIVSGVRIKLFPLLYRNYIYETLSNRSVIEVSGIDSKPLLQGLMTNDVNCMNDCHGAIYSFFLNAKGRILCDVFVYNGHKNRIFLECDEAVCDRLMKHINLYKLRKKVSIRTLPEASVTVVIPESPTESLDSLRTSASGDRRPGLIFSGSDPRLRSWVGRRVSLAPGTEESQLSRAPESPPHLGNVAGPAGGYLSSRHRQGLAEGLGDHGWGVALPLEHNGDITNAVSFNKGCYVGQELTARTHHTGVVRKRLMPATIGGDCASTSSFGPGAPLFAERGGEPAGVVRAVSGGAALVLVRLSRLQAERDLPDGSRLFKPLYVGEGGATAVVRAPAWWPSSIVLPPS